MRVVVVLTSVLVEAGSILRTAGRPHHRRLDDLLVMLMVIAQIQTYAAAAAVETVVEAGLARAGGWIGQVFRVDQNPRAAVRSPAD